MNLNWKQCIICQTDTSEPLKCPLDSLNTTRKTDAYSSFLENVQQFRDFNALFLYAKVLKAIHIKRMKHIA